MGNTVNASETHIETHSKVTHDTDGSTGEILDQNVILANVPTSKQILRQRIAGLYEDALTMSKRSKTKAALLKACSLITTFLVILLGTTIAILAVFDFEEKNYLMVILGCVVALLKSMVAIFNPEYRSSVMKQIHVRARKLARQVMDLIHRTLISGSTQDHAVISDILTNLQKEYDDLDLASFMATVVAAQTYVDMRTSNESGSLKAMQQANALVTTNGRKDITKPNVDTDKPLFHPTAPIEQPEDHKPNPIGQTNEEPLSPIPIDQPEPVEPTLVPPTKPLPQPISTRSNKRPMPPPRERPIVPAGRHWIQMVPPKPPISTATLLPV